MKLFELNDLGEVSVNKPWIALIPEFRNLFLVTEGRANKARYSSTKGKQYLAFIYYMLDFSSPLRDWEATEKLTEAIRFSGLTDKEVKSKYVQDALKVYKELQEKSCRALKTYRAAQLGMDKMDEYFTNMDFTQTDKQGKLLYTPNQYIDNISKTNKAYDELDKLAKRVEVELSQSTGIRGLSELGERELQRGKNFSQSTDENWSEDKDQPDQSTSFLDIADSLHNRK